MKRFSSKILSNTKIADKLYRLKFLWTTDACDPLPGQFVTIRISEKSVPLLRRPFAVSGFNSSEKTAEIIYLVVGEGTRMLSEKQKGDTVDTMGPAGNSFPVFNNGKEHILAAGGIGLGPICFLAKHLKSINAETRFFLGSRNAGSIPDSVFFNSIIPEVSTDDGSSGFKGNVINYIKNSDFTNREKIFYGCGPYPMLKSLCEYTSSINCETYVSMERVIACGTGACMGCVIELKSSEKYARVCKDGPVFKGSDIIWK